MVRRIGSTLLFAAALAAGAGPTQARAQQPADTVRAPERPGLAGRAARRPRMATPPIELLIQHRDTFRLTDEQVDRLREAGERVREANEPLLRELLEIRRAVRERLPDDVRERRRSRASGRLDPELREELAPQVRRIRALLREIRRNGREAMRTVHETLTAEQRDRLREWVRNRRDARAGVRDSPDGAREPPGAGPAGGGDRASGPVLGSARGSACGSAPRPAPRPAPGHRGDRPPHAPHGG